MNLVRLLLLVAITLTASGCEVIGGIFKAGMIAGILIVIVLLAVIFWVLGKLRRR